MVICYRCHQYKALNDFYCSNDDPLAQVCKECKREAYAEKGEGITLAELEKALQYWQGVFYKVSDDRAKHGTGEIVRMIKEQIQLKKDEEDGKQE